MQEIEIGFAATPGEAEELDEILWQVLWKPLQFPRDIRETFTIPGKQIDVIARVDGQIAGGLVAFWLSETEVELRHLAVVSEARGCGLGRELVSFLVQTVTREGCLRIHTIARNTSRDFFHRLGFRTADGIAPDHPVFSRHGITFELMEFIPLEEKFA